MLPESNCSPSTTPILGKEDWKKELVNSSHSHMIKGLKPGTSYRVRVVARDLVDSTVHSTDEVLVSVPGEAACLRISGLCIYVLLVSFLCRGRLIIRREVVTFRHGCTVV